jgi:hypothetical protein
MVWIWKSWLLRTPGITPAHPELTWLALGQGGETHAPETGGQCRLDFPRFLLPPHERVMAIIRDGGIPIVSYNGQGLRVSKICLVVRRPGEPRERLTSVSATKSLLASKEYPHINRSGKTESWPSRLLARGR